MVSYDCTMPIIICIESDLIKLSVYVDNNEIYSQVVYINLLCYVLSMKTNTFITILE